MGSSEEDLSSSNVKAATPSSPSATLVKLVSPSQPIGPLIHYYVDMLHTHESNYDVEECHVTIHPAFHAHLQEHQDEDINKFLALLEVIPARKRKRQQPFLTFTKSKILTFVAYIQGCEEVLAQRLAHEAEAKKKAAEEASKEVRAKEK